MSLIKAMSMFSTVNILHKSTCTYCLYLLIPFSPFSTLVSCSLKFMGRVALNQLDSTIYPMLQCKYMMYMYQSFLEDQLVVYTVVYIISSDRNYHIR